MNIRIEDLPEEYRQQATEAYARQAPAGGGPSTFFAQVESRVVLSDAMKNLALPPANPARVAHGKRAQRKGREFEREVDAAVKAMRDIGIADLAWDHPAVRIVRGDRNPKTGKRPVKDAHYAAKGSVDLSGTLAGGRAVRVELKACRERVMNLARYLTSGEREALDSYVRMGALAFLLVRFDRAPVPGTWYLIPWREVRGAASVAPEAQWACRTTLFLEGV